MFLGLCEIDNVNKAGYTPVMLAALTAAESPDDLEVAHQLLRLGDVNARSRQVTHTLHFSNNTTGKTRIVLFAIGFCFNLRVTFDQGTSEVVESCVVLCKSHCKNELFV